ncbi:MAG: RraA family protein [Methylacidiphilales bacterium]|nr:RraA family protein [Candidatus Methylacidiphilales bacterium]
MIDPSRHPALTKEEFQDLRFLDSCAVANAIERFRIQLRNEGHTEGSLVCRYPHMLPVLGYAMTLKVRSSSPPSKGQSFFENTDWWDELLAVPAPRILVVQDMDRFPGSGALIGDLHACILKKLDCVGVVTNGAVRDLPRIEGLDFQMFSGSLNVSHAYSHIVHVGGPVQIGSLEISPGDLIHGDCHGIVRIPRELATRIPATASALRDKEEKIMTYCHSPGFSVEGLRDLLAEQ